MKCPKCENTISELDINCPKCGVNIAYASRYKKSESLTTQQTIKKNIYTPRSNWEKTAEFWYKHFKSLPDYFFVLKIIATVITACIFLFNPLITNTGFLDFLIILAGGAAFSFISYAIDMIILSPIYLLIEYQRQIRDNTKK